MNSTEEWRAVAGYEGQYEVSNAGRVRSLDRTDRRGVFHTGRVLVATPQVSGHLSVTLSKNSLVKTVNVHKLVAHAFLGDRPLDLQVRHGDGVCDHNAATNLTYATRSVNTKDAYDHGALKTGSAHHMSRYSAAEIAAALALKGTMSSAAAAASTGMSARYIRDLWAAKKRTRG